MNRSSKIRTAAWALMGAMLVGAAAQAEDFSQVEAKIRNLVPNAGTLAISETPIPGILQVQMNNDIVYTSADGDYLLQGPLYEVESRVNLTDRARAVVRREKLEHLDDAQSIDFAPEGSDYDLLVFTDIDCGYCRKLHSQIAEYMEQGIAIHYLAFPRAGIGSPSYNTAVSVWCADDRQGALTAAKAGEEIEPLQCENPVAEQYQLGLDLGVTGTPALLTADGSMIPGYMPPETLRARLDAMAQTQTSP